MAKRTNAYASWGNTPFFREKRILIVLSTLFAALHVLLFEIARAFPPAMTVGTALLGCVLTAIDFVDRRKEQIGVSNAVIHVLLLFASMYFVFLSVAAPWGSMICAAEILILFCTCASSWRLRTHPEKRVNHRSGRHSKM